MFLLFSSIFFSFCEDADINTPVFIRTLFQCTAPIPLDKPEEKKVQDLPGAEHYQSNFF